MPPLSGSQLELNLSDPLAYQLLPCLISCRLPRASRCHTRSGGQLLPVPLIPRAFSCDGLQWQRGRGLDLTA
jgi:hypothetical protein